MSLFNNLIRLGVSKNTFVASNIINSEKEKNDKQIGKITKIDFIFPDTLAKGYKTGIIYIDNKPQTFIIENNKMDELNKNQTISFTKIDLLSNSDFEVFLIL